MSTLLQPEIFPLYGSRLIEASAGTGKTWTIASLYVRLVLGHGDDQAYRMPLHPAQILVMTFTRAATRELSDRIRQRLNQAAALFRAEAADSDPFLDGLLNAYPDPAARELAAYRLSMAAQAMDEAAVMTIDAWCQRMLKEHAFDSACLFDEELISDESLLFEQAVRDYWRQQVYPLDSSAYDELSAVWPDIYRLENHVRALQGYGDQADSSLRAPLAEFIHQQKRDLLLAIAPIRDACRPLIAAFSRWLLAQRESAPKQFSGTKLKPVLVDALLQNLHDWAESDTAMQPEQLEKILEKFDPDYLRSACNKGYAPQIPDEAAALTEQLKQLATLPALRLRLYQHAALHVRERIAFLKLQKHQAGFGDMLRRLRDALLGENGHALRSRMLLQFPVAMIDEFQDTSPDQYAIFNALYRIAGNDAETGLFLIGDPKQSIYGFRGADIYSYLKARRATAGRHYVLGTNFRSTAALVKAVNLWFEQAEKTPDRYPGGAFLFRTGAGNGLPFEAVSAKGKAEQWMRRGAAEPVFQVACGGEAGWRKDQTQQFFAEHCAQHILERLNDEQAGFASDVLFRRLQAGDIAVLVRDRNEAEAVRQALQRRQIASVYLSDKDSVFRSQEAADLLRWLNAFANPADHDLARAAFASKTVGFSLERLAQLASDEQVWDECIMQIRELHSVWQRQGVLAAIRRFVLDLRLPSSLLREAGGERSLTNILHLAELLEEASEHLDGELALVRWLAEAIRDESGNSEEHVLRLESDAELVQIITIHKSKGLQFPLVYLPFANSYREVNRRNRLFFEYTDEQGKTQIDFSLSEQARAAVQRARLREDLRLLYVALTRPVYGLWLGVAAGKSAGESAFAYLLSGNVPLAEGMQQRMEEIAVQTESIHIEALQQEAACELLVSRAGPQHFQPLPVYQAGFERDWSIASFSSMTRQLNLHLPVARMQDMRYFDDETDDAGELNAAQVWHRFPRGAMPGQFLHEQLEWLVREGLDFVQSAAYPQQLARRCERAGWSHQYEQVTHWLHTVLTTPLPPLGSSLAALTGATPELEFWFPCDHVRTEALDAFCHRHVLAGKSGTGAGRPPLTRSQVHGLMMGFADLVFEHEGRYWIIDYKSNALGEQDAAYHAGALQQAVLTHRYDVQAAIYQLALHRLLRSRLGDEYDPEAHLGGVIFLFLRGIGHVETRGCCHLSFGAASLAGLDALMESGAEEAER